MATSVVVFKILFLVLIAHSFVAQLGPKRPDSLQLQVECRQEKKNAVFFGRQPSGKYPITSEQNEKWFQPTTRPVGSGDDDSSETAASAGDDNSAVEIRWPTSPPATAASENAVGQKQQQRPAESTLAKSSASDEQLEADVTSSTSRAPDSASSTSAAGEEEAAAVIAGTEAEFGASGEVTALSAAVAAGEDSEHQEHQEQHQQQQLNGQQLLDKRVGELWRSMMSSHNSEGSKQQVLVANAPILAHESNENDQAGVSNAQQQQEKNNSNSSSSRGAAATSSGGQSASSSFQSAPVNYAELCYLADGSSSLTLTVNEATPVGSVVGTVEVNGDPSLETGNVDLFDGPELSASPQAGLSSSASSIAAARQVASDRPEASSDSAASSSANSAVGGGRAVQRMLGRRALAEQLEQSSQTTTSSSQRLARGQPPPLSASETLALTTSVGDSHSHSPSFYSLLSSAGSPASPQSAPSAPSALASGQQQAVRLEPGTRNLILVRQLDKESGEGEQSLVINIRCSPRNSSSVQGSQSSSSAPASATSANQRWAREQLGDTVIPVRIIVTDANDHAPEFLGQQPYIVNISETAPIGSIAARDILAVDRDSAGPFSTIHYKVLDEGADVGGQQAASSLLQFANPLEPTLIVVGQLDYETLGSSFTLTVVAQDQAEPEPLATSAQVQVNIIDFDDQNPRFMDDKYTLIMDESQQSLVGQNLQVLPRNLYAEDGDRGIRAPIVYSLDQLGAGFQQPDQSQSASMLDETTVSSSSSSSLLAGEEPSNNIEHYLHLNPASGEIRLIRQWPSKWAGPPMTLVVRATQADNKDRYTLTTLTVTRPNSQASSSPAPSTTHHNHSQRAGGHRSAAPANAALGAAESSTAVQTTSGASGRAQGAAGIEFVPNRLVVSVAESAPINEKIARVRARHLTGAKQEKNFQEGSSSSLSSRASDQLSSVDLVADLTVNWPQSARPTFGLANNSRSRQQTARAGEGSSHSSNGSSQATANRRPINYQLLDDQTDQFGINGLGEIFLKRALDFELRQEFKFRVLATYTKYSDICQIQVNVLNVNDNKPKFTQPQYTFHLTETRLKSNLIGSIQAHDADINDTLHYSLTGDQAHLFEINSSGLLSLRPNIKQLNVSSCQLVVQATDSLSAPFHSQQARVNLHVAPQLLGRSLNFESSTGEGGQQRAQIGSRSLSGGGQQLQQWNPSGAASSPGGSTNRGPAAKEPVASQRSSVATVMASLQHMVRSVSFLDMPMSSALLLSALLAFLVCLLLIVVISMSVHFYRRRAKARQTRRRHLAAAAHLRQAHLAALHGDSADSAAASSISAVARAERARYLHQNQQQHPTLSPSRQRHFNPQGSSSPADSSTGSSNSSPTNSTSIADANSPNQYSPASGHQQQQVSSSPQSTSTSNVPSVRARLTAKVAPASTTNCTNENHFSATSSSSSKPSLVLLSSSAQQTEQAQHHPALNQPLSIRSPLDTLSARLQSVVSGSPDLRLATGKTSEGVAGRLQTGASSLISSLSSHSKGSYRSNSTDDSSVMHCGHYSVNPAAPESAPTQHSGQQRQDSPAGTRPTCANKDRKAPASSRQESIEAAIKNLVRQNGQQSAAPDQQASCRDRRPEVSEEAGQCGGGRRLRSSPAVLRRKGFPPGASGSGGGPSSPASRPKSSSSWQADEFDSMTAGRPGIKSYRKLSMMGSLARPLGKQTSEAATSGGRSGDQQQADSAIASDASSGASNSNAQETAGLMAMIRDPDKRQSLASEQLQLLEKQQQQAIRWPQGVIPTRVKKLTWDDELSISGVTMATSAEMAVDCYLAPELTSRMGSSSLSNHHYNDQQNEHQQQLSSEQHFLFSNPCSPALEGEFICPFVAPPPPPTQAGLMMLSAEGAKQQAALLAAALAANRGQHQFEEQLSSLGQNNCFDYTIVQQSQFQVDSFAPAAAANDQQHQQHLLQPQQQHQRPTTKSYLYTSNGGRAEGGHQVQMQALLPQAQAQQQQQFQAPTLMATQTPSMMTNQDLRLRSQQQHHQVSTALL